MLSPSCGLCVKPFFSHFSTERKEVESASLGAKEERSGILKEGRWRGRGEVVDSRPGTLHHHFLLFPSRKSKMPETESELELLAASSSEPESVEAEHLQKRVQVCRISV